MLSSREPQRAHAFERVSPPTCDAGEVQAELTAPRQPAPSFGKAELSTRIAAIERMSRSIESRVGTAAARRFDFQCSAERRGAASEDFLLHDEPPLEVESECIIPSSRHIQELQEHATAAKADTNELQLAVCSLAACERKQSLRLQQSVRTLKASFRAKLEQLEAAFVSEAEALSEDLAHAVRAERHACETELQRHARSLCMQMSGNARQVRAVPPFSTTQQWLDSSSDEDAPESARRALSNRGTLGGDRSSPR